MKLLSWIKSLFKKESEKNEYVHPVQELVVENTVQQLQVEEVVYCEPVVEPVVETKVEEPVVETKETKVEEPVVEIQQPKKTAAEIKSKAKRTSKKTSTPPSDVEVKSDTDSSSKRKYRRNKKS